MAELMAGRWIENDYFTPGDFVALGGVTFTSNPAIVDFRFVDRLGDPASCEVERTQFDMSGFKSKTEKISINCKKYWKRVELVDRYYRKHGAFPVLPIITEK